MKETLTQDQIPEFIQQLGDVRGMFLDENVSIVDQPEKYQKVLSVIWDICSFFIPSKDSQMTDIKLIVSSMRLVDLDLVSKQTGKNIGEISSTATESIVIEGDEIDSNNIEIRRTDKGEGFMITEIYKDIMKTYEIKGTDEKLRVDCFVEEKTKLTRNENGELEAEISLRRMKDHLHFQGATWVKSNNGGTTESISSNMARCINTTLALLVEAAVPSHIQSSANKN